MKNRRPPQGAPTLSGTSWILSPVVNKLLPQPLALAWHMAHTKPNGKRSQRDKDWSKSFYTNWADFALNRKNGAFWTANLFYKVHGLRLYALWNFFPTQEFGMGKLMLWQLDTSLVSRDDTLLFVFDPELDAPLKNVGEVYQHVPNLNLDAFASPEYAWDIMAWLAWLSTEELKWSPEAGARAAKMQQKRME